MVARQRRVPMHFNGGASMLRTDLVRRFGGLTPELKWHCDWFVYQLIAFDSGIVYVPEIFSTTFIDGDSIFEQYQHLEQAKSGARKYVSITA
jgi:hypothetical protein